MEKRASSLKLSLADVKREKFYDDSDDSSLHDSDLELVCCFGKMGKTDEVRVAAAMKNKEKAEENKRNSKEIFTASQVEGSAKSTQNKQKVEIIEQHSKIEKEAKKPTQAKPDKKSDKGNRESKEQIKNDTKGSLFSLKRESRQNSVGGETTRNSTKAENKTEQARSSARTSAPTTADNTDLQSGVWVDSTNEALYPSRGSNMSPRRSTKEERKSLSGGEDKKPQRRTLSSIFSGKKGSKSKKSDSNGQIDGDEETKPQRRTLGSLFSVKRKSRNSKKEASERAENNETVSESQKRADVEPDNAPKAAEQVTSSRRTFGSIFSRKRESESKKSESNVPSSYEEKEDPGQIDGDKETKPQRRTLGSLFSGKKESRSSKEEAGERTENEETVSKSQKKSVEESEKSAEQATSSRRTFGSIFSVKKRSLSTKNDENLSNTRINDEDGEKIQQNTKADDNNETKLGGKVRRTLGSLFSVKKERRSSEKKAADLPNSTKDQEESNKTQSNLDVKEENNLPVDGDTKPQRRTFGSLFSAKKRPESKDNEINENSHTEPTKPEIQHEKVLEDAQPERPSRRTLGSLFSTKRLSQNKESTDKEEIRDANISSSGKSPNVTEPQVPKRRTLGFSFPSKKASVSEEHSKSNEKEPTKIGETSTIQPSPIEAEQKDNSNARNDNVKPQVPQSSEDNGKEKTLEDTRQNSTPAQLTSDAPPAEEHPRGSKTERLSDPPVIRKPFGILSNESGLPDNLVPQQSVSIIAATSGLKTSSKPSVKNEEQLSSTSKTQSHTTPSTETPLSATIKQEQHPIDEDQEPREVTTVVSQIDFSTDLQQDMKQERLSEEESKAKRLEAEADTKPLLKSEEQSQRDKQPAAFEQKFASELDNGGESKSKAIESVESHNETTLPTDIKHVRLSEDNDTKILEYSQIMVASSQQEDQTSLASSDAQSVSSLADNSILANDSDNRMSEAIKVTHYEQFEMEENWEKLALADDQPKISGSPIEISMQAAIKQERLSDPEALQISKIKSEDEDAHTLHAVRSSYNLIETSELETLKHEELITTERSYTFAKESSYSQTEGSADDQTVPAEDPECTRGVQTGPYRFLNYDSSEKMLAPTGDPVIEEKSTSKSTQTDCVCNNDSSIERMNTKEMLRAARAGSTKQNKAVQTDTCLSNYVSSSEENSEY